MALDSSRDELATDFVDTGCAGSKQTNQLNRGRVPLCRVAATLSYFLWITRGKSLNGMMIGQLKTTLLTTIHYHHHHHPVAGLLLLLLLGHHLQAAARCGYVYQHTHTLPTKSVCG